MKNKTGFDRQITQKWRRDTQLIRGGTLRSNLGETSEAIFMTSGFAYATAESAQARFEGEEEGFTYSRQGNPTIAMFEERMALIEGAEAAAATASGMAAMNAALLGLLRAGDHVVAGRALFGSCRWLIDELLPRYGIETTTVNGPDLDEWKRAIRPNTKLFFLESPSNPTLEIIDIQKVADLAHEVGARLVVDNVFASPILQKPLDLGADVVCYSATKHIDGQGRTLGGIILSSQAIIVDELGPFLRHTGPSLSPFNAWLLLKSLETLELRVNAMCDRADHLAAAIAQAGIDCLHPSLPGFKQADLAHRQMKRGGTVVTFTLPGGAQQAFRFLNALSIIDISNNLGDSRSIAAHPWTTTHKALDEQTRLQMGITPGMIRLSAGLEDKDDLVEDVLAALAASAP
ncbi:MULTISPECIES: O-succinylhomoserine sulfhydrylase [unclassified Iodidimonas]|jgi:O-succinylhomoserine sulfhydrylase|uniref:O-succinylhomoserine sulfhydrylase n=1 Tax=unclassified Iodidimonas TaxID=2626145 RepID=UPI002482591F|nr:MULTISPECIES: O-succinylhomoserine sulfhydrylase [unclassified Iodidimonas]